MILRDRYAKTHTEVSSKNKDMKMDKLNSPEIRVSLSSTCEVDCECGEPYSAVLMAWGQPSKDFPKGTWYNAGCFTRAETPEKAFEECLQMHREQKPLSENKMDDVGIGYWRAVLDFREMMQRGYTLQEMWSLVFKPFVCGPLTGERTPLSIPKREKSETSSG